MDRRIDMIHVIVEPGVRGRVLQTVFGSRSSIQSIKHITENVYAYAAHSSIPDVLVRDVLAELYSADYMPVGLIGSIGVTIVTTVVEAPSVVREVEYSSGAVQVSPRGLASCMFSRYTIDLRPLDPVVELLQLLDRAASSPGLRSATVTAPRGWRLSPAYIAGAGVTSVFLEPGTGGDVYVGGLLLHPIRIVKTNGRGTKLLQGGLLTLAVGDGKTVAGIVFAAAFPVENVAYAIMAVPLPRCTKTIYGDRLASYIAAPTRNSVILFAISNPKAWRTAVDAGLAEAVREMAGQLREVLAAQLVEEIAD